MSHRENLTLLTGAAGYIGSHTWIVLHEAGFNCVGVDNFVNSSPVVLERIAAITGRQPIFEEGDVTDAAFMQGLFAKYRFTAVVHLAALKAVGESVAEPLKYYRNNLLGLLNVCAAAREVNPAMAFVFCSSATVYGDPETIPIAENTRLFATHPYSQTKLMSERILQDMALSSPGFKVACLRCFNPVGAHPSGLIGEDPSGAPSNLMPYLARVACGKRHRLNIFGNDYATSDGTGVRDYLHVMDLARGHAAALAHLLDHQESFTVNLGTGRGYSVLEVLRAYELACGKSIAYNIVARRPGDVAAYYANASKAWDLLGWRAELSLAQMCEDSWRWQTMNPDGYRQNPANN